MSRPSLRVVVPHARPLAERYEFVRELGRGASGIVYLARDLASDRPVAVKVLDARHAAHDDAMRRFLREARTASSLEHPRIVRTLAIEPLEHEGIAIVSEYVPGMTLRALLQSEGALSFERSASLLRDVAAALAHAHRNRIVHRDVKPENIFVSEDGGRALLADFGIARALDGDSLLTESDVAIGTPSYMAPEAVAGIPTDERADVYALGLVGWELLTGARPWAGETLYSVLHKQQHESLPSLASLRPHIPAYLLVAIEGALHKARDRRWRDGGVFLSKLTPRAAPIPETHRPQRLAAGERSLDDGSPTCELPRAAALARYAPSLPAAGDPDPETLAPSTFPGLRAMRRRSAFVLLGTVALVALAAPFTRKLASPSIPESRSVVTTRAAAGDVASTVTSPSPNPTTLDAPPSLAGVAAIDTEPRDPIPPSDSAATGAQATTVPPDSTSSPIATSRPATTRATSRGRDARSTARGERVVSRRIAPALDPRCRSTRASDQSACLAGHVAQADVPLDRTYRRLITVLRRRSGRGGEPVAVSSLRREQRIWLIKRDMACQRAVRSEGRPLWGLERAPCYASFTRTREAELRRRIRAGR